MPARPELINNKQDYSTYMANKQNNEYTFFTYYFYLRFKNILHWYFIDIMVTNTLANITSCVSNVLYLSDSLYILEPRNFKG